MNDHGTSRRRFIGGALVGAAGAWVLPKLGGIARAELRPGAPADRLLVVNLVGGIRSSAAFLASTSVSHNPYGLIDDAGLSLPLGRLLDDHNPSSAFDEAWRVPLEDAAYTMSATGGWRGSVVPRFREMAGRFAVLGTYESSYRGDHNAARYGEPTGSTDGAAPGLLARVQGTMVEALSRAELEVPAFHIAPEARFDLSGPDLRFAPVELSSWQSLPSADSVDPAEVAATGHDWSRDDAMRGRLDVARMRRRGGWARSLAAAFAGHRRSGKRLGARLAQPEIGVGSDDETALAASLGQVVLDDGTSVPLTNAMLREVFERTLGPDAENSQYRDYAIDAALAVRLLQMGSPAVVLEIGSFDFHSGERSGAPELYRFFGRLWATLEWLLARTRMPDSGASMLERTLVTTMSDFGRDSISGGWNPAEGTDHGSDQACYYLAHSVMGAGVIPGRVVGGVDTTTYAPGSDRVYTPKQLLATMMWALGLDHGDERWGLPGIDPITELWS